MSETNPNEAVRIEKLLNTLIYTPELLTPQEWAEIDQITKEFGGKE